MTTALQPRSQNAPSLETSQAYQFMIELKTLKNSTRASNDQFVDLFNRWVKWVGTCDQESDPLGYGASFSTIFSVVHFGAEKKVISQEQKRELEQRAVQVLKKSDLNSDRARFLKQYE